MRKYLAGLLILIPLVLTPCAAFARQPVVYAVLFFMPTCPHCRLVIDSYLPNWKQEFGDQFNLVMVDVTTQQGKTLYQTASETPGIQFNSLGVPVLVIGNTVLLGDVDIEAHVPTLIRYGLTQGGIELPPIKGLREAFAAQLSEPIEPTFFQRLKADPIANGLAIGVLLALVMSTVMVVVAFGDTKFRIWMQGKAVWIFALAASLVATGLASTLFLKSSGTSVLLTGGITLALLVETVAIAESWPNKHEHRGGFGGLIPLAALPGIAIAAYLSNIEMTQSQALCGLVGDCNAVQQSPYAMLFGVLPIGILGIVGYIGILLVWFIGRIRRPRLTAMAQVGLRGMALFGVIFSIYLTFLEPFVIGATCVWCLTSAVIMLLLLWLAMVEPQSTVDSIGKRSLRRRLMRGARTS